MAIRLRLALSLLGSLAAAGCASGTSGANQGGGAGSGGGSNSSSAGAAPGSEPFQNATTQNSGGVSVTPGCGGPCQDFPGDPILDTSGTMPLPGSPDKLFGKFDDFSSPGPCVVEPQLSTDKTPGALIPKNWVRPRFKFSSAAGETVFEIRVASKVEANDLVAYTTATSWGFPRDLWKKFSVHAAGTDVIVTIRGVNASSPKRPSGTRGNFTIAPVEARGKMVYWATTSSEVQPTTSKLVGFDVGDEGVIDALTIPQVGNRMILAEGGRNLRGMYDDPHGVAPGAVQCIGCHTSTPDGAAVAFTDHWPWDGVLASIEQATAGQAPDYLTPGAARLLNQPWLGMQTFSAAHFKQGDRILVTSYSPRQGMPMGSVGFDDSTPYPSKSDRLAWFDLETSATFDADPSKGDVQMLMNQEMKSELGKSFGIFAMDGETRSAATPSFSHDGTRIVYTSSETTQDGRLSMSHEADLHMIPYNNRQGGMVTEVAGASDPGVAEYYPAFSADDQLIAFTRVQKADGTPLYYRPDGEVYVVPSQGGKALRLAANDPPACTNQSSPGIINSWPKWSPSVQGTTGNTEFGKRTYYWLIFSSARAFEGQHDLPATQYSPQDRRSSQLYITGIVRDETSGELITYPAVYIWNQDPSTSNLTPAWDEFKIPPVPGPV